MSFENCCASQREKTVATETGPIDRTAALTAAYQVTARWFASEQQLIWRRTAFFVTLNSLVVVALQFLNLAGLHPATKALIPLAGVVYSVAWHFSMNRSWAYQTFLTRMLREQEEALQLGQLGAFTRSRSVMHGGPTSSVAGEDTKVPPRHILFRAQLLADATTWLFVVIYALWLANIASQFK